MATPARAVLTALYSKLLVGDLGVEVLPTALPNTTVSTALPNKYGDTGSVSGQNFDKDVSGQDVDKVAIDLGVEELSTALANTTDTGDVSGQDVDKDVSVDKVVTTHINGCVAKTLLRALLGMEKICGNTGMSHGLSPLASP